LKYWSDTFNSIKDHIWILDKDGTILQCNKSSEETFYQQVCDITGNKCYKIMHDSESFTSDCPFQEMCKSFKREVRELLRDGKTYSITVDPIFDEDGKYNGAVHIMSDITDLKKAESQMRDFAAHLQKVREEERTSLARTLHDNFGQLLTGLKMEVSVMEKAIGKLINFDRIPDLSDKIKTIKSVLDDSVALTGKISMELRPSILDNFGLIPAIEWLVSDFSKKSGIKCNLICGIEELNLNKSHCTEIFRIIQESLTNVVRHANATLVNIRIELLNEYYEIEIEDNGKGITQDEIKSPMAMGLLGMKERTVIFNGKIEISGKPGKETKIVLKIPKEKND
jgi:PAS domain S-box-containing protein